MSHIIIFGSIGFIIAALIVGGLILWALDDALSQSCDNGGGGLATIFVIAFAVLYYFFGSQEDVRNAFSYVITNPSVILAWFGGYLGLGVIWGFVKWYFFLHKQVDRELSRLKHEIITEYSDISIPTARDNKWRIMSWMMYWPFSAFWTAIDQPIKYAFNYLFSIVEGWFDKISKSMYQDVNAKINAKKEALREERKRNGR
jgi:hypothetical protein